jgi:hypothetical protein
VNTDTTVIPNETIKRYARISIMARIVMVMGLKDSESVSPFTISESCVSWFEV